MRKKVHLHIRRCHLCAGVSECEGAMVASCQHCGKVMAPFYFFDEFKVLPLSDVELRVQKRLRAGERTPVRGLTACW